MIDKTLVRIGSDFTLHCICHNVLVQWYHNDNLARNITSVGITFNKITKTASGIYKCIEHEYNVTLNINITIYCKLIFHLIFAYELFPLKYAILIRYTKLTQICFISLHIYLPNLYAAQHNKFLTKSNNPNT